MNTPGRPRRRGKILALLAAFATLACAGTAFGADPPAITGGPATDPTNVSPSYTITGLDPTATIEWTLTLGGSTADSGSGLSPLTVGPLGVADGVYTLSATQTVPLDPVVSTATIASFVLDRTGPAAPSIVSGPPAISNVRSQSFTYTASEVGGTFEYQLNGATAAAGDAGVSLTALADGTYTFSVRQVDVLGNAGPFSGGYTFSIDGSPPGLPTIQSGPPAASNIRDWAFTYSGTEAGGTFQYQLNGGTPVGAPAGGVTLAALADGSYTFAVRQTDALGNVGLFSSAWAFAIDGTSPVAPTLTTFPATPTNVTTPTFAWNGEIGIGVTSHVQIVGPTAVGPAVAASPYVPPVPLVAGTYTFQVSQNDVLGNVGPAAVIPFTVDTVPPAGGAIAHVPATNALAGFSRSTTIAVNLATAAADTVNGTLPSTSAITYALTAANLAPPPVARFSTWAVGTPRTIVVPATQGSTTIFLWARDAAGTGNVSAALPLAPAVAYDATAPVVAGTSFPLPGANATTNFGALANVRINVSEPVQIPVSAIRMCIDPCGVTIPAGVTLAADQTGAILDPFPAALTSPLATGTRYEVQLANVRDRAGNALTGPGSTSAWTFTTSTDGTPPGKVTNLVLSPGIGQIALKWTRPGDPDLARITVLRGTNPPASAADATAARFSLPAVATSFTDVGLTPGVTYHYAVYAEDAVENPSELVRASAVPIAPPIVVTGVLGVPKTWRAYLMSPRKGAVLRTLRPLLRWKPVKGATRYNIQIFDGTKKVVSAFPKGVKYSVPKGRLKQGRRLTWHVWAYIGASHRYVKRPMTSWFDTSKKAKK